MASLRIHSAIEESRRVEQLKDVANTISTVSSDHFREWMTEICVSYLDGSKNTIDSVVMLLSVLCDTGLAMCAQKLKSLQSSNSTSLKTSEQQIASLLLASHRGTQALASIHNSFTEAYIKSTGSLQDKVTSLSAHLDELSSDVAATSKALVYLGKFDSPTDVIIGPVNQDKIARAAKSFSTVVDDLDKHLNLTVMDPTHSSGLKERMASTLVVDDELGQFDYFSDQKRLTLDESFKVALPFFRGNNADIPVTFEWMVTKAKTRTSSVFNPETMQVVERVEPIDKDLQAIRAFTAESQICYEGNRALREYPVKKDLTLLDKYRPFEMLLDNSLSLLPSFKGLVYRGVNRIMPMTPGQIITFLQPSSASTDARVVKNFLNKSGSLPQGMIFVIDCLTGRSIEHVSDFPEEREVLFRVNTQFRVLGDIDDGTTRLIEAALRQNLSNVKILRLSEVRLVVWEDLERFMTRDEIAVNAAAMQLMKEAVNDVDMEEVYDIQAREKVLGHSMAVYIPGLLPAVLRVPKNSAVVRMVIHRLSANDLNLVDPDTMQRSLEFAVSCGCEYELLFSLIQRGARLPDEASLESFKVCLLACLSIGKLETAKKFLADSPANRRSLDAHMISLVARMPDANGGTRTAFESFMEPFSPTERKDLQSKYGGVILVGMCRQPLSKVVKKWIDRNFSGDSLFVSSTYPPDDEFNMLHACIQTGDLNSCKSMLSKVSELEINSKTKSGMTALMLCVLNGYQDLVSEVLQCEGVDLEAMCSSSGDTALLMAARLGFTQIAELLLKAGAKINRVDFHGNNALLLSAMNGRVAMVRLLLGGGAIGRPNCRGDTPLISACLAGETDVVSCLLETQVGGDLASTAVDKLLHQVCASGHTAVAKLLLSQLTDVNLRDDRSKTALHYAAEQCRVSVAALLLSGGSDVNAVDVLGRTPLHYSSMIAAGASMCQLLIEHGANVNLPDSSGWSPLHWASRFGHEEVVLNLLENRDIQFDLPTSASGLTPTWIAARHGKLEVLVRLLSKRPSLAKKHILGRSILHVAVSFGHVDAVAQLLRYPEVVSTVNHQDDEGATPLFTACKHRYSLTMIEVLCKAGAATKLSTLMGETPMHAVTKNNDAHLLKVLMSMRDANVNATDIDGNTPLHIAAKFGSIDCLTLLVKSKATQISRQNNSLQSALHISVYLHCMTPNHEHNFCIKYSYFRKRPTEDIFGDIVLQLCSAGCNVELRDGQDLTAWEIANKFLATDEVRKALQTKQPKSSVRPSPPARPARVKTDEETFQELIKSAVNAMNHPKRRCNRDVDVGDLLDQIIALKQGAFLNESFEGFTVLHWAAYNGRVEDVEKLLSAGANAQVENFGNVLMLNQALDREDDEIATLLLDRRAVDINAVDEYGNNSLQCVRSHSLAVRLLAEGASIHSFNREGLNALHVAAQEGRYAVMMAILHHCNFDKSYLNTSVRFAYLNENYSSRRINALNLACMKCDYDLCSAVSVILVLLGINHEADSMGLRPLHHAALNNSSILIACMSAAGVDLNQPSDLCRLNDHRRYSLTASGDPFTVMQWAKATENDKLVNLLEVCGVSTVCEDYTDLFNTSWNDNRDQDEAEAEAVQEERSWDLESIMAAVRSLYNGFQRKDFGSIDRLVELTRIKDLDFLTVSSIAAPIALQSLQSQALERFFKTFSVDCQSLLDFLVRIPFLKELSAFLKDVVSSCYQSNPPRIFSDAVVRSILSSPHDILPVHLLIKHHRDLIGEAIKRQVQVSRSDWDLVACTGDVEVLKIFARTIAEVAPEVNYYCSEEERERYSEIRSNQDYLSCLLAARVVYPNNRDLFDCPEWTSHTFWRIVDEYTPESPFFLDIRPVKSLLRNIVSKTINSVGVFHQVVVNETLGVMEVTEVDKVIPLWVAARSGDVDVLRVILPEVHLVDASLLPAALSQWPHSPDIFMETMLSCELERPSPRQNFLRQISPSAWTSSATAELRLDFLKKVLKMEFGSEFLAILAQLMLDESLISRVHAFCSQVLNKVGSVMGAHLHRDMVKSLIERITRLNQSYSQLCNAEYISSVGSSLADSVHSERFVRDVDIYAELIRGVALKPASLMALFSDVIQKAARRSLSALRPVVEHLIQAGLTGLRSEICDALTHITVADTVGLIDLIFTIPCSGAEGDDNEVQCCFSRAVSPLTCNSSMILNKLLTLYPARAGMAMTTLLSAAGVWTGMRAYEYTMQCVDVIVSVDETTASAINIPLLPSATTAAKLLQSLSKPCTQEQLLVVLPAIPLSMSIDVYLNKSRRRVDSNLDNLVFRTISLYCLLEAEAPPAKSMEYRRMQRFVEVMESLKDSLSFSSAHVLQLLRLCAHPRFRPMLVSILSLNDHLSLHFDTNECPVDLAVTLCLTSKSVDGLPEVLAALIKLGAMRCVILRREMAVSGKLTTEDITLCKVLSSKSHDVIVPCVSLLVSSGILTAEDVNVRCFQGCNIYHFLMSVCIQKTPEEIFKISPLFEILDSLGADINQTVRADGTQAIIHWALATLSTSFSQGLVAFIKACCKAPKITIGARESAQNRDAAATLTSIGSSASLELLEPFAGIGLHPFVDGQHFLHVFLFSSPEHVEKLLKMYPDSVNVLNKQSETILMRACQKNLGHRVISIILSAKAVNVDLTDMQGKTALHYASRHYSSDVVRLLLSKKPRIIADKNGDYPFQQTTEENLFVFAEFDVNFDVIIDKSDNYYLHRLCADGDLNALHIVVKKLKKLSVKNRSGIEPLHNLIQSWHGFDKVAGMIRLFKENGFNFSQEPWLICTQSIPVCKLLLEFGANPLVVDAEGNTVVHRYFIHNGNDPEYLTRILDAGVNGLALNANGETCLDLCTNIANGTDHLLLINRGKCSAELASKLIVSFIRVDWTNPSTASPYFLWLLKMCDKFYCDNRGFNLLHLWIESVSKPENMLTCFEAAIKAGVNPNHQDLQGRTPLHFAVIRAAVLKNYHEFKNLIAVLVKCGADVEIVDKDGKTALDYILDRVRSRPSRNILRETNENDVEKEEVKEIDDTDAAGEDMESSEVEQCEDAAPREGYERLYWAKPIPDTGFPDECPVHESDFLGITQAIFKPYLRVWTGDLEENMKKLSVAGKQNLERLAKNIGTPLLLASRLNLGFSIACFCYSSYVNFTDNQGRTALHCVLYSSPLGESQRERVKVLLEGGADVNATDNIGNTALHIACSKGDLVVVDMLLRRGATVSLRGQSGRGVWHQMDFDEKPWLIRCHDDQTVMYQNRQAILLRLSQLLLAAELQQGVRPANKAVGKAGSGAGVCAGTTTASGINQQDEEGRTALHCACMAGDHVKAAVLCEQGADLSVLDDAGMTALQYALSSEVYSALEKWI